jgi:hypothetical protein
MISPPSFAKGGTNVDAVAEFRAFVGAVGEPAASFLAELADLQNHGVFSDIPKPDISATSVNGLYCRVLVGWAVFYTARRSPFEVTILHAGTLNPHPFHLRESEAAIRLNQLR